jgi:hypothetical protein
MGVSMVKKGVLGADRLRSFEIGQIQTPFLKGI